MKVERDIGDLVEEEFVVQIYKGEREKRTNYVVAKLKIIQKHIRF